MGKHTLYNQKWRMQEVVPYLLKHYFQDRPTSNKELSEAFWKLMGKDVEIYGRLRWTTGKTGVPYQIHRLTKRQILAEASSRELPFRDLTYPEYAQFYLLGRKGEEMIQSFEAKYGTNLIEKEIQKYLGRR